MRRRSKLDSVDEMCVEWAKQRRRALGIITRDMEPHERLGKIRSTLASVREEGEGASYSSISQSWPEVYTGESLLVHRGWWSMCGEWREVMHTHYVWKEIDIRELVKSLEISSKTYYERLALAKSAIDGYVRMHSEKVEKPQRAPVTFWRESF